MSKNKESVYSLRIPPETKEQWEAFAEERGFPTMKDLIIKSVNMYIESDEMNGPAYAADLLTYYAERLKELEKENG